METLKQQAPHNYQSIDDIKNELQGEKKEIKNHKQKLGYKTGSRHPELREEYNKNHHQSVTRSNARLRHQKYKRSMVASCMIPIQIHRIVE